MRRRAVIIRVACFLTALAVLAGLASAAPQRPARPAGSVIVPDRFVRPWDPVTLFFDTDLGPVKGGPEDRPERVVTLDPPHPGAFTWIDARTLQFRPADPWPALTRFKWKFSGKSATLATLMTAPSSSVPADGATNVASPESITLTFSEPLDVEALRRMVRLELRPHPGLTSDGARWIGGDELEVKSIERRSQDAPAQYALLLSEPIAPATRVLVHLRLALDDAEDEAFRTLSFTTSLPFRVASVGCPGASIAIGPSGSRFEDAQALACGAQREVFVNFTSKLGELDIIAARNLVRFTPAVDGLAFTSSGSQLTIKGAFKEDTLYRVSLTPSNVRDASGHALEVGGTSLVPLHFSAASSYLQWRASQGIVERFGPQRVPVAARGDERVDLRIHRIDPLDRSYWPFPQQAVALDESQRPPGPGEAPEPFTAAGRISSSDLSAQIAALGSPALSAIVELPSGGSHSAAAATFGLDLEASLARIAGSGHSGTYLVGLRRLDASSLRSWMRVQVTDLCVTVIEEPRAVKWVVTSLSKGTPIVGARVRVDGTRSVDDKTEWMTLVEGVTGGDGSWRWDVSAAKPPKNSFPQRLVVSSRDDILVLDPSSPPEAFHDNFWAPDYETWLGWTVGDDLSWRGTRPRRMGHLFSERPVYRPEETVHLKGWLRTRQDGKLVIEKHDTRLIIVGPDNREWRNDVEPNDLGGVNLDFHEDDIPTGTYRARLEEDVDESTETVAEMSFRVEAYRLPRFEVRLSAPEKAPLDEPFSVKLSANYYAGGRVSGRPVRWRVTQMPHDWQPAARDGFVFSTDARFSGDTPEGGSPRLDKEETTDADGSSVIEIDPSIEPTAQPRVYIVEATVTGEDDQTVTSVERVVALPPFALGLSLPRYVERATEITPRVLVLGADGKPLAGKELTVRLLSRQWHSHLQAGDFSEGIARYVTDVVDEKVSEQTVTSGPDVIEVKLPIARSGVYIVEVESRDRLDRAQLVSADCFVGGDAPVAWKKPATRVFTVAPDAKTYDPGQVASLVLQSPFQTAEALAIIEEPDGNRYEWLSVRGGSATLRVPIESHHAPRLPVHVVLWRGRVAGAAPSGGATDDPGRPATMASTTWLDVRPVGNRVDVTLEHPERARAGETIDVKITLKDPQGNPLAGEVTLWLVDQAVLALGREQRLDPVPDFLAPVESHLTLRDTRNLAFGELAYAEEPGGDSANKEASSLLDRTTVRRNFSPVPYWEPSIRVGADGVVTVKVKLADSLTNFMVRAKAAAGAERFGFATGRIAVRLPVIIEPALPRFVRPGDSFIAAAIGRVVEGEGGAGRAEARFEGLTSARGLKQDVALDPANPSHVEFAVKVDAPPIDDDGRLKRDSVSLSVAIERIADGARDAFEVKLPLKDDRRRVTRRELVDLAAGATAELPAVSEPAREGSVRRSVAVANHRGLLRLAAGLDLLVQYPYGCTEQRVSRTRAQVALRKFRDALGLEGSEEELAASVSQTQSYITSAMDSDGLVGYWPGSRGYVCLTAWVLHYLIEARGAGFEVDPALVNKLTATLERSLRSDWSKFIDGEAWLERTWALSALSAAGKFSPAYGAELSRKAANLDLEAEAQVLLAFEQGGEANAPQVKTMAADLRDGVAFRLYQGREIYGGLQDRRASRSGLVIPSETRTLAQVVRALRGVGEPTERMPLLVDALIGLGKGDGWGTTNANAEALLALSELLDPKTLTPATAEIAVQVGGAKETLRVGQGSPLARWRGVTTERGQVTLMAASEPLTTVRLETSWIPRAEAAEEVAVSQGFVVTREIRRVQADGSPALRTLLDAPSRTLSYRVGDVIEDHVQVVCPEERHFVAVVIPLGAGMEPLNPALATAPPEATPAGTLTTTPSYVEFLDDRVAFYYDTLKAGTHDFYFRTRATVPGTFGQPAATAEMMYDGAVHGGAPGARIEITRAP